MTAAAAASIGPVRQVDITQRDWTWQVFGDRLMLVTETGGALVVLCPKGMKGSAIETRDPRTGTLRGIKPDDAVAKMIAAAPAMARAIAAYFAVWDRCGGSEAVGPEEFAAAREDLRNALAASGARP